MLVGERVEGGERVIRFHISRIMEILTDVKTAMQRGMPLRGDPLLFFASARPAPAAQPARGTNAITAIPASASAPPSTSQRSGRMPSTAHSHTSAVTTYALPYAA